MENTAFDSDRKLCNPPESGDITGLSSVGRGQRLCRQRFTAFHSTVSVTAGPCFENSRLPLERLPCSQEDARTGGVLGNSQSDITERHSKCGNRGRKEDGRGFTRLREIKTKIIRQSGDHEKASTESAGQYHVLPLGILTFLSISCRVS